jgi:beta-N-acetylhexosaminidase
MLFALPKRCVRRQERIPFFEQAALRMTRPPIFVLLILGHVLGQSLAAYAEEREDSALRRTIGQKIVVGFFGQKNTDPDFRRVLKNLEQGYVGGVLFLGRNISSRTDLEIMVREVKNCKCSVLPLIAVDEEGGVIERLGETQGFSHTASAAEVGRESEEKARADYERLAKKLSEIGFNLNLAPVVDLNLNLTNPIIGRLDRSFSSSPQTVSRYASIFIEEHHKRGIATALKHFPGHGSSSNDSHDSIANVETSWSSVELVPYETLIGLNIVDCVMVGHLSNASRWGGVATQDGSGAIGQMLRQELKFDGVVLSDDLSMKAVRSPTQPFSEVIKSSVLAGVDIVIVSRINDDDETSDIGNYANSAILKGVLTGEIDRVSVSSSVERVEFLRKEIADGFASKMQPRKNKD